MDTILAPAKLNIRLAVTGVTGGGYHFLEMINIRISLCDVLTLTLHAPHLGFTLESAEGIHGIGGEDLTIPENNILYKAYHAFCRVFKRDLGIAVQLTKRIPIGAGLGGGSSDAAALLMYLAKKVEGIDTHYHKEDHLMECALQCGADVPFFLAQSSCLVSGIGEKIIPTQLPILGRYRIMVIVPPLQLSTKEVFAVYDKERGDVVSSPPSMEEGEIQSLLSNDLLPAVKKIAPVIGEILHDCSTRGILCSLTGSGSALFALILRDALQEQVAAVEEIAATYRCQVLPVDIFHKSI